MSYEKVKGYFEQAGLGERVVVREHIGDTVEHAAEAIGCEPARIAKSMSFLADGQPVVVVMAGDARIHNTMLMYGKEASNRKQEIDRQHHTIPNQRNQRPKDKHRGNVYNLLFRHGKVRSQNMEKLKCSFPTFCKQTFPQLHKIASYAHYAQCRLLRNPSHSYHYE
ncbi:MAG: hypothetical protein K2O16_01335 [Lachnospiraceae bacterium]|nr:hypothetical protein [Lachnospiraceae bacterium]